MNVSSKQKMNIWGSNKNKYAVNDVVYDFLRLTLAKFHVWASGILRADKSLMNGH